MTKRLTRILCLIFVSAILISTISASDIITGTKITTSPGEGTRAGCYVEKIVRGIYRTYWSNGGMLRTTFDPTYPASLSNLVINGHRHTGTLTTWQLWDDGASSTGYYRDYDVEPGYDYCYVYEGATAKYYGTLTCVG